MDSKHNVVVKLDGNTAKIEVLDNDKPLQYSDSKEFSQNLHGQHVDHKKGKHNTIDPALDSKGFIHAVINGKEYAGNNIKIIAADPLKPLVIDANGNGPHIPLMLSTFNNATEQHLKFSFDSNQQVVIKGHNGATTHIMESSALAKNRQNTGDADNSERTVVQLSKQEFTGKTRSEVEKMLLQTVEPLKTQQMGSMSILYRHTEGGVTVHVDGANLQDLKIPKGFNPENSHMISTKSPILAWIDENAKSLGLKDEAKEIGNALKGSGVIKASEDATQNLPLNISPQIGKFK